MPLPAESLTPRSSDEEIKAAIAESIALCIEEGKEQDQCVAIAYSMAREATGKGKVRLALAGEERKVQ
jgi:hypothetical protein